MVPMEVSITEFLTPATDIVDALVSAAPVVLGGAATIVAGLIAFQLSVRIVRRFAK